MTIILTRESIAKLHTEAKFAPCFKFGFRGVLFINKISEENLVDLINPQTGAQICNWSGTALVGKGGLFYNQKDNSWEAIPVTGKTCLIFGLGGDRETATKNQKLVMDAINTALPNGILTASDITMAAKIGSDITHDVYNSDLDWYSANTQDISAQDNFHFVEGKGTAATALFIPGNVSIDSGATATPQLFPNGAYLVATKQADKTMEFHGCDPQVFESTYRQNIGGTLQNIDTKFVELATCPLDLLIGSDSADSAEFASVDGLLVGALAELQHDTTIAGESSESM